MTAPFNGSDGSHGGPGAWFVFDQEPAAAEIKRRQYDAT
jgi:hypothetical protein